MLRPKNKLHEKISAIILCAGEGKRISDFIQNIPKPLIELNNKPLLMHIISNLTETSSIIIITGHLGNKIKKYVSSKIETNNSIYEKIKIIDSGENYKKGPLYSFLSIMKKRTILKRNKIYLVIPGDTFFEPDIFNEIFNTIINNFKVIKTKSVVFYQKVQSNNLKSESDPKKRISLVSLEHIKSTEIVREIQQRKLADIGNDEDVNQIMPVFIFNYKLIKKIINTEKIVSATTIREILNYIIQEQKNILYAHPINPYYRFIDVDTKSDYLKIQKKKKDNRGSDQSEYN